MIKEILILTLLSQIISCENTTGQFRHDKKHHQSQVKINYFIDEKVFELKKTVLFHINI